MKTFLEDLFQINDPGRLAGLKRIFGDGGSEVAGLRILAALGVTISDQVKSIPYKIVAYLHGRKISNGKTGNIAAVLRHAAMVKEKSSGELSFDKRFDSMVACRDLRSLKTHIIRIIPFLDDYSVDYEILLRDLIEWSSIVRDRWIETYYQAGMNHE